MVLVQNLCTSMSMLTLYMSTVLLSTTYDFLLIHTIILWYPRSMWFFFPSIR